MLLVQKIYRNAADDLTTGLMLQGILSADDGEKAWEILKEKDTPQIALLDWEMPGMDGIEVCRRAKELKLRVLPYIIIR